MLQVLEQRAVNLFVMVLFHPIVLCVLEMVHVSLLINANVILGFQEQIVKVSIVMERFIVTIVVVPMLVFV